MLTNGVTVRFMDEKSGNIIDSYRLPCVPRAGETVSLYRDPETGVASGKRYECLVARIVYNPSIPGGGNHVATPNDWVAWVVVVPAKEG